MRTRMAVARSRFVPPTEPIWPAMLVAAIVVGLAETILGYHLIHQHGLIDGDNYMRLVRIRDGLRSGWFTHVVANDNAGMGTVVYWSHAIDAVVLALRAPLLLALDDQNALYVAGAIAAPLFAALLAAVLVWAPAPLVHRRWLWTAPAMMLFSPALRTFGTLGDIHHHLPLALMAVLAAACAGRATAGRRDAGAWCGVCAAIAVWISPEALPYVLMAMGAIGIAWCLRPAATASALMACGTAFALATIATWLCDPPYGGWLSPEIDCVSIAYATLAALVCAAAWSLSLLGQHIASVRVRFLCCVAAGATVIGAWLWLYPGITQGLDGLVPPADAQAFFGAITEMRPMTMTVPDISMLLTGAAGTLLALGLAWRRRSALWAYAGACGLVVLALAISHIRFEVYVEAIGALILPVALEIASSPPRSPTRQSVFRLAIIAGCFLGPQLPAMASGSSGHSADIMGNCHVADIAPALRQQSNAIVLTEINDAPEILWRTPVRTVGSFYHRSIGAFIRARNAWRTGPSSSLPPAVLATGATHILACEMNGRTPLVSDLPPATLQDRLDHHQVPSWLHEVAHSGGYYLYRIDGASPGGS